MSIRIPKKESLMMSIGLHAACQGQSSIVVLDRQDHICPQTEVQVRRQCKGPYVLALVQDLSCFSRVGSVATAVHMERKATVPNAVGKVHGHSIRVVCKLQLADNAGGFVLVRMPEKSSSVEESAF